MTTSSGRRSSLLPTPLGLTAVALLAVSVVLYLGVPALLGTEDSEWWTLDGGVLGRVDLDEVGLDDPDVPGVAHAFVEATAGGVLLTAWLVAAVAGARRAWARLAAGALLAVVAVGWLVSLGEIYPRTGPGGYSTSSAYWVVALATATATWLLMLALAMVLDRAPASRPIACALLLAAYAVLSAVAVVAMLAAVPGLGVTVVPVVGVAALLLAAVSSALWSLRPSPLPSEPSAARRPTGR
ncbi:MAG: hypothetical protein Q7T56_16745 [Nocardioidaceae bacterium]|nr:hypothetical protein [Nocardioidaceae bacterium]